jgi:hypothetical protein
MENANADNPTVGDSPVAEPASPPPTTFSPQPLTPEHAAKIAQASLIAQSDEAIARRTAMGKDCEDWQQYRTALQDVQNQPGYPLAIMWPVQPSP